MIEVFAVYALGAGGHHVVWRDKQTGMDYHTRYTDTSSTGEAVERLMLDLGIEWIEECY